MPGHPEILLRGPQPNPDDIRTGGIDGIDNDRFFCVSYLSKGGRIGAAYLKQWIPTA